VTGAQAGSRKAVLGAGHGTSTVKGRIEREVEGREKRMEAQHRISCHNGGSS